MDIQKTTEIKLIPPVDGTPYPLPLNSQGSLSEPGRTPKGSPYKDPNRENPHSKGLLKIPPKEWPERETAV